jgi:hypothetical protein
VFALIFFLGPECADLHLHTCTCSWPLRLHFQRFVLKRPLYLPPLCFLPTLPLYCSRGSTISPRVVPLRTAMRLLPLLLLLPLHPPPPSCSCPSHGDNGNAQALLQPAGIPGLTHLQPIQWLVLLLRRNDVCVLCPLGSLWRPLIDQKSDFIFLFVFGFEDGTWCWLRPHQETLCCTISVCLLLFLNRKTEKLFLLFECLSPPTALCPFHTPALFRPGPLT